MFSAIMHEVVISIPFKYIALHAFFGMILQAPLIFITKYIDRRSDNAFIGNAMFWCMFCIVVRFYHIIDLQIVIKSIYIL